MILDHLFKMFAAARDMTGHSDYVVIGSLSVLGLGDDSPIPADMTVSNDIDCFTKADPERILDVQAALGADSAFHVKYGYCLNPVSPSLPALPEGWEDRMNMIERDGIRVWFLEPNDAAMSKYARGERRDQRWIRAGAVNGLISLPTVNARLKDTLFVDAEEERAVRARIEADRVWFEAIKASRKDVAT